MDVVLLFMLHVQARRRRQEELEKQRQEEQLRKQQVTLHLIWQSLCVVLSIVVRYAYQNRRK
jgi:putative copper export protein